MFVFVICVVEGGMYLMFVVVEYVDVEIVVEFF